MEIWSYFSLKNKPKVRLLANGCFGQGRTDWSFHQASYPGPYIARCLFLKKLLSLAVLQPNNATKALPDERQKGVAVGSKA